MQQVIDPVVLGLADSLVEAAATGCRGDDVPEPYPPPDEGNPPEPAIMPEPGPLAPEEPKEAHRGA